MMATIRVYKSIIVLCNIDYRNLYRVVQDVNTVVITGCPLFYEPSNLDIPFARF